MGKSNIHIIDIPLEELENMEEMFFRQILLKTLFSKLYHIFL